MKKNMEKINKEQFLALMEEVRKELLKYKYLRLGQTVFNVFAAYFPIAEAVRGSKSDPFYNNLKLIPFMEEVLDEKALEFWQKSNVYKQIYDKII